MTKNLTGADLKHIAIFTMLIDHIGAFTIINYFPFDSFIYLSFRLIGRIAFPIFCFLIVEGYLHTKNIKKYLASLLISGFISEIPFDLVRVNTMFDFSYQNVFFTLFAGLLSIYILDKYKFAFKYVLIGFILIFTYFFNPDYNIFGVIFILALYLTRKKRLNQLLTGSLLCIWELTAPLAFLLIYFYNDTRGKQNKYFFYMFYPLHLLIIYFVNNYLLNFI